MIHPFGDYFIYYIAAALNNSGLDPYGISQYFIQLKSNLGLNFDWATGFSYPPVLLLLLKPFSLIPAWPSAIVWTMVNVVGYTAYCFYYIKTARNHKLMGLFLLTFLPVWGSLLMGQVNIVVLWLVQLYLIYKPRLISAIFIVLAGLIKVFPVLMLLRELKQKKLILWCGLLLLAFSIPYREAMKEYVFKVLPQLQSDAATYFHIQSYHGYLSRLNLDGNTLTIAEYLPAFILFVYIFRKANQPLVWLAFGSVFSGLNSFVNFTIALPVTICLINRIESLGQFQKSLLAFSVLCTNLLFPLSIIAERSIIPNNLINTVLYSHLSSLGFFAMAIQLALIIKMNRGHNTCSEPI